jgi:hypothetical protein
MASADYPNNPHRGISTVNRALVIALKLGLVLAGYALALAGACEALWIRLLNTQDPATQASSGMYAFGDFLCLIGTFGILSLAPTGLALYFLRPWKIFWTAFALGALMLAVAGPIAACVLMRWQPEGLLTAIAFIGQSFGAPLLAVGFLISTIIAPTRHARWLLLLASLIEGAVSVYVVVCLFVLGHWLL